METIGQERVWIDERYVDGKYIREHLSVSRTKAYEIICEVEKRSHEREAVLRIGRSLRVRKDVFERWIFEHGTGGSTV